MTSEKLLYVITDENSDDLFYKGITYSGKYVYASNRHIFAKVKYDVPKEYKGCIILSDGQKFQADKQALTRISYKVDDYIKAKERDTVELDVLSDLIVIIRNFNTRFPDKEIAYIGIGGYKFSVETLKKFLSITDELFLFQGGLSRSPKATALISRDNDNIVMAACCDSDLTKDCAYINYDTMTAYSDVSLDEIKSVIKSFRKINKETTVAGSKELKKLENELVGYEKITWKV